MVQSSSYIYFHIYVFADAWLQCCINSETVLCFFFLNKANFFYLLSVSGVDMVLLSPRDS